LVDAALIGILVVATLVHLGLFSSMRGDILAVFLVALAISTALAVVPLSIIWFLDRRERETPFLLAAVFFWGGCIATALALPFNTAFFRLVDQWVTLNPVIVDMLGPDAATLIAAPLSAPIAEELAKAAGVGLIFWLLRDEFDNMRDGFVYGALVGVGFNWFEAPLYVAQSYAESGVAPYGLQLGVRYALFGLGGHAMFTGLFGMFLGLAMQTQRVWLRLLAPVVGLLLAVAAHMLNNSLPLFAALAAAARGEPLGNEPPAAEEFAEVGLLEGFVAGSLMQLTTLAPFLLIVAVALWRSGIWERRVIREELAPEVGRSVTPGEYQRILADGILRTRRIDELHPSRSAALVNAQHELAFRKRRARDMQLDAEQDALVDRWRQEIWRLRESA
jgi:RsiW-degrading membrane proteinase PrsW (M82 family)